MVCPYCQHNDTSVVNSRQHKSQSKIWRRRQCVRCKTIFTTYELVAHKELPSVMSGSQTTPFNTTKLLISIYTCLPDSPRRAEHAQALSDTVYQMLSERSGSSLANETIANTTYEVIKRFNPRSGLTYAVEHNIITPDTLK